MVSNMQDIEIYHMNWYKVNDVAQLLGYSRPRKAVIDHVCLQDKKTPQELQPRDKLRYND